ncbi:MAG: hypothetical protein LBD12_02925 [Clostridiales Family XIII bacterium]|nr:hypothetical protein [Clostridiales Family XIII bacterium]
MESLDSEIEQRIARMEREDYVFPKRFGKKDYALVITLSILCLAALIAGAFLR